MGCPTSGTVVFVYPIQNQYLSHLVNGSNEPHSTGNNSLFLDNSKALYLELAPFKDGLPKKQNIMSPMGFPEAKTHAGSDIELVASPRTPSFGSKILTGDESTPIVEDSVSSGPSQKNQSVASFDVREALGDETAKRLLQTCAASWLYSRCLLPGNLVTVPMFSELCIFRVTGAKTVSVDRSDDYLSNGSSHFHGKDSDMEKHENKAIIVKPETKVYLSLSSNVPFEKPIQRDLFDGKLNNASSLDKISKLGGLSKEYAILKDIILSSVKDALSRYVSLLSVAYFHLRLLHAFFNPLVIFPLT